MEPYAEIRTIEKRYSSIAMALSISSGMILILADMKPMGKGLILGALFSVINFVVMGETLPGRIAGSRNRAALRSGASLLGRYILMAVPLVMAIRFSSYHLVATIVGLFMIQILILAHHSGRAIYASKRKKLDY